MKSSIHVWTKKLVTELDRDLQDKITSWEFLHGGMPVELVRPDGTKIYFRGVKFVGSPKQVFWTSFIDPFLVEGITRTLNAVAAKARQSGEPAGACIREAAGMMEDVVRRAYRQMAETSSKLSGDGITKGPVKDTGALIERMTGRLSAYRDIALAEELESDKKHSYLLKVANSLSACQMIELELKLYVTQALELVEKCVANRVPFRMKGVDYQNASLERLIEIFKKLNDNAALAKQLVSFKDERNFVAHGAITACLDADGNLLRTVAADQEARLKDVEKSAAVLAEAIQSEAAKFVAHLYFDPVAESKQIPGNDAG